MGEGATRAQRVQIHEVKLATEARLSQGQA